MHRHMQERNRGRRNRGRRNRGRRNRGKIHVMGVYVLLTYGKTGKIVWGIIRNLAEGFWGLTGVGFMAERAGPQKLLNMPR